MPGLPVVVWALVIALAACGGDGGGADPEAAAAERWAAIVVAVLDQVVLPGTEADHPVIFVVGPEEQPIPIEVQVEVVDRLAEQADVRFVDGAAEAVAVDRPGDPVRDEGVLVAVGPVPEVGGRVTVPVERYRSSDDVDAVLVTVARTGTGWRVVEDPRRVPPTLLPPEEVTERAPSS